jgi:hypothetical protein
LLRKNPTTYSDYKPYPGIITAFLLMRFYDRKSPDPRPKDEKEYYKLLQDYEECEHNASKYLPEVVASKE